MRSDWITKKIGDVCEIHRGASPRPIQNYLSNKGMPWVKIADATGSNSRYILNTSQYIIEDGISKSVLVTPGTLIVSNSATPGLPKILGITACVHDGWLIFSNFIGITRDFLYYKFVDIRRNLVNQANGSIFQNLKTDIVRDYSISIPPISEQDKIVSLLLSFDDKIELNNRIIANLEHQAQAIFGNLFPDCMSNGISMSSILDVRDGTHDSPKSKETGYYLITSKHLQPYSVNKNEANLISDEDYNQINERSKVEYGDILISMIGTVGLISLVSDEDVDFAIKNVGLFRTSQNESLRYYILNYLKSNDVTIYIEQHLAGSTQKYISLSELRNLPINIPSKDEIIRFNSIVKPIYRYIINLNRENLRLVAIRDALLPKLMSGEINL